jgi:hypothetical protein
LRHSLPGSLEHMVNFISSTYGTITLLYETVLTFRDTWIECLGDLARYRMAIEDQNMKDREIWTKKSRDWYTIVSNNSPTVGRLYHHLAILARPSSVLQLSYYAKSVCVPLPFFSTREFAMGLFTPHLATPPGQHAHVTVCEGAFIRCHGIIFSDTQEAKFTPSLEVFKHSLDKQISSIADGWSEQG